MTSKQDQSGSTVAEAKPDRGLSCRQRITRTADFRRAYDQGKRYVGKLMVLWLAVLDDSGARLGVTATKKIGKANKRARAKRLLREAWRLNRFRFSSDKDVILVARRAILNVKRQEVEAELLILAKRAGIYKEDG